MTQRKLTVSTITMADPHVIAALVKRRAELAGDLDKTDDERRAVLVRLDHIDATLALFGYVGEPREGPDLATNLEIAGEVIRRKGWSPTNRPAQK